jgi:ABC-type multidrug transport system fused ATPase/permease subunit
MANLHDEIISWPQGYETVVGQRANAISGGQAQRLCLARALVTDPALLVLDEPTSALDAISEHSVQQALGALRGRTTIFIIAHRLSTLSVCDRILVLNNGRVDGFGTRDQLADEGGFYQQALRLSGLVSSPEGERFTFPRSDQSPRRNRNTLRAAADLSRGNVGVGYGSPTMPDRRPC